MATTESRYANTTADRLADRGVMLRTAQASVITNLYAAKQKPYITPCVRTINAFRERANTKQRLTSRHGLSPRHKKLIRERPKSECYSCILRCPTITVWKRNGPRRKRCLLARNILATAIHAEIITALLVARCIQPDDQALSNPSKLPIHRLGHKGTKQHIPANMCLSNNLQKNMLESGVSLRAVLTKGKKEAVRRNT